MKYGIYYAYWEDQWKADYIQYIEKVAKLGFDFLEIACTPINGYSRQTLLDLRQCAADNGIFLTAGHGPSADQNLASDNPAVAANARAFFTTLLKNLETLGIHTIGGGIYSYWPVDYSKPIDKPGDWARSVAAVREVGRVAADCGVDYCLEVLNRFEGYLLNTAAEGVKFVREVDVPAVKVMLDTFHMNIEEDSIGGAIRSTKGLLGHFHTGECNRRVPGRGRTPWHEIATALADIGYDGMVCMEPFVRMGGKVGEDIKIWCELEPGIDEAKMDADAKSALDFERIVFEGAR
ncbi:MAG: sugar phosphate isomerase/epimerase [Kiritimatiellae bacterium]|nr:sugar phosphate isomerase/epimerase [Kiritimatiellia bacterium]